MKEVYMRKLTQKEKLKLHEDLSVAKIRVLTDWEYTNEEIAKILGLPVTEVNIYVKRYNIYKSTSFEDLVK